MFKRYTVLMLILSLLLMGCATIGLESPQTPKQKLAYAWSTLEGIYSRTTLNLDTKAVSEETARQILDKGMDIEKLLNESEKYLNLNGEIDKSKLNLINRLLIDANNFLLDNGGNL